MNNTNLFFYEDDEGITSNIILECFSETEVSCVYLERFSPDRYFLSAVDFIVNNQHVIHRILHKEVSSYIDKVYKNQSGTFSLTKIYILPDITDEFGFMLRWPGDSEHGIGVKFSGTSVKKIGSAEVAFL